MCEDADCLHKASGAKLTIHGAPETETDGAGNQSLTITTGETGVLEVPVHVEAQGFSPADQTCTVTAGQNALCLIVLERPAKPRPNHEPIRSLKPLHAEGPIFKTEDGVAWRWKGVSAFLLYRRYLDDEDIEPFLSWSRLVGANTLRVWLMSHWLDGGGPANEFHPDRYGDRFWSRLPGFIQHLAEEGFRIEFTVFSDAQEIIPRQDDQQRFLDRVVETIRGPPTTFLEVVNEPGAGNGVDPARVKPSNPGVLLWSSGDYDIENRPTISLGTYGTYHGARSDLWASESAKEGHFYYDGWDAGHGSSSPPHRIPWVNDEPMGAGEFTPNRWGDAREINADNCEDAGAGFALSSAGGTAHGEDFLLAKVPGSIQTACASRMLRAMDLIPEDAPTWQYEHDGTGGMVTAPVNDQSIVGEVVARVNGSRAYVLATNTTPRYRMVARNGWSCTPLNARKTIARCER